MLTILHEHDCDQDYGQRIDTYLDHKHLIIIGHRQRLLHILKFKVLLQIVQPALLKMPPKKGPVLLSSLDEYFGEEFGQKF